MERETKSNPLNNRSFFFCLTGLVFSTLVLSFYLPFKQFSFLGLWGFLCFFSGFLVSCRIKVFVADFLCFFFQGAYAFVQAIVFFVVVADFRVLGLLQNGV